MRVDDIIAWLIVQGQKMRFILLCLISRLLFSYEDEELLRLWRDLSDIHHPTVEDYQRIETYLNTAARRYLDPLRFNANQVEPNKRRRLNNILNFKLLGPNQELPIFEIHHLNVTEATKDRCILLFGSYNGIYPEKVRKVLKELKECGYSGDVLLRIGGFPNVEHGGLKICHVPYAFKVAFLQEARERGYKEAFWMDTCMHPLNDLEKIFSKIKKRGYYFTHAGKLLENLPGHLPGAAQALNIGVEMYNTITHLHSSLIGLNMESPKALHLLDSWYAATEEVFPNITWFPEELSLSVVGWRLGIVPDSWFGMVVCGDSELEQLYPFRPTLQFYCEELR